VLPNPSGPVILAPLVLGDNPSPRTVSSGLSLLL